MRFSIHVDAGYLYGALATRETGSSNRDAITVDDAVLIRDLVQQAADDSGATLLRVLWYDAGRNGLPDGDQRRIGMLPGVKLRMGRINPFGEQKGVDLRLGLDLMSMSITRAVGVAYVISGDDDLTEAVTDAQDQGLQVKLIAVPGVTGQPQSVAANLQLTADGTLIIPAGSLDRAVTRTNAPQPRPSVSPEAPAAPAAVAPAVSTAPAELRTSEVLGSPARAPVIPLKPAGKPPVPSSTYAPAPRPVFSSSTGMVSTLDIINHADIAEVASATLKVWITTATPEQRQQLVVSRPVIPSEIDRLLLTDLVNRTDVYDIPTWARFELRQQFWAAVTATIPDP